MQIYFTDLLKFCYGFALMMMPVRAKGGDKDNTNDEKKRKKNVKTE